LIPCADIVAAHSIKGNIQARRRLRTLRAATMPSIAGETGNVHETRCTDEVLHRTTVVPNRIKMHRRAARTAMR